MRVLLETRGYGGGAKPYRRYVEIDGMPSYQAILAAIIAQKEAWMNGIQIMKGGLFLPFAHNKRHAFVSSLMYDPEDDNIVWEDTPWPI